jgi:hypothetical protein
MAKLRVFSLFQDRSSYRLLIEQSDKTGSFSSLKPSRNFSVEPLGYPRVGILAMEHEVAKVKEIIISLLRIIFPDANKTKVI